MHRIGQSLKTVGSLILYEMRSTKLFAKLLMWFLSVGCNSAWRYARCTMPYKRYMTVILRYKFWTVCVKSSPRFRLCFLITLSFDRICCTPDMCDIWTIKYIFIRNIVAWCDPDDIFKCIFLNENIKISMNISLKFVPFGLIDNIPALAQIIAWHWPGAKPLSEPTMINLLTHICVTQLQWVNTT